MIRRLYLFVIRLHPLCFRQRFAEEMLDMFDQAAGARAVASLFTDVLLSLFRQWVLRSEFRQPMIPAADSPAFRIFESYKPRPAALLNGGLMSMAVLWAVALVVANSDIRRQVFLIGVHHPGTPLLALERPSYQERGLNTTVKYSEPEDPWRAIASIYFKHVRVLAALDSNQDLIISSWEIFTAPVALRRLDTNHDGKLSPEECGLRFDADAGTAIDQQFLRRARVEFMRVNPVLAAMDANHDGEISDFEISNSAAALKTLDKNGDGSLTPDELIPDRVEVQAAMILARLDTDADGRISIAERANDQAAPLQELLESADRNRDGFITFGELAQELRLREERKRQFDNASRAAGAGRRGH